MSAIDEAGGDGFTLERLVEREALPFTQVAVALAFLKERGVIETRYRRNYAATESVHLDAMTEFHPWLRTADAIAPPSPRPRR